MQRRFVLSIGFPNYTRDKTGMSKVILAHQNLYNKDGVSFVHLFAVKKLLFNDNITLFSYYGMLVDGVFLGVFTPEQVINKCQNWFDNGHELLDIHLHHFLYMVPEKVEIILKAFINTPINVYLHDYYLACTEYTLLRNKEDYCGGRGLTLKNCEGCRAYKESMKREKQIHRILAHHLNMITFISPSEITKQIFETFHPEYIGKIIVVPHQNYSLGRRENTEVISEQNDIRVAFTAMPRRHKGWEIWTKLANRFNGKGYEFIIFNSTPDSHSNMRKHEVYFTKNNLNAMTDALLDEKVHLSVLWSICPETYSYTCFESYSANSFIVTNNISGNIADVVTAQSNGIVLENEKELFELFEDRSELLRRVNEYRKKTQGGPVRLEDNDAIIKHSLTIQATKMIGNVRRRLVYNAPLIKILSIITNK